MESKITNALKEITEEVIDMSKEEFDRVVLGKEKPISEITDAFKNLYKVVTDNAKDTYKTITKEFSIAMDELSKEVAKSEPSKPRVKEKRNERM